MRFASYIVRFDLGSIPVVGNTKTGAIIGLTSEGVELCDALLAGDVSRESIPKACDELVEYFEGHDFFENSNHALSGPISAYLHITDFCNRSCIGCYSAGKGRNRYQDPSLNELCRAAFLLKTLGVQRLIISGGEPFLRNDLPQAVDRFKKCGISHITLLTNGTVCEDAALANLAGIVDEISVSLDISSPLETSQVRGDDDFRAIVNLVQRIKAKGIHATLLATLHSGNVDSVPNYIELAHKLGVTVGFTLLSDTRGSLGVLAPSDTCLVHLADVMSAAHKRQSPMFRNPCDFGSSLCARASCGAGRSTVSIAVDGDVFPCHMLHFEEFCLGNAFTDDIGIIRQNLRRFSMPSVDVTDGCSVCDKRYLCGGGCKARSYREYGRLDTRDPYCAYYSHALNTAIDSFLDQLCK